MNGSWLPPLVWLVSVLGLAGFFVLYPAGLWFATRRRSDPLAPAVEGFEPSVTMLLIVRNGEALIEEKLRNSLQLDYPPEKLELLVWSDGSTDGTERLLREQADDRIKVFATAAHRGKVACLNEAAVLAGGELLLPTDADALFEPDALRKLVAHFADSEVGGVCGQRVIAGERASLKLAQNRYIDFDSAIKRWESRLGSITSNDGKIYAIRRELFDAIPATATDDFFVGLNVTRRGRRFIFEPGARARIRLPARSPAHEVARRRRIVVQSLSAMATLRELFDPRRHGVFSLRLAVNKLLRRLSPLLLLTLFAGSLALAFESQVFAALTAAQLLFYVAGLSHPLLLRLRAPRLLLRPASMVYYFVLGQVGMLLALVDFSRGRRSVKWNPIKTDGNALSEG